MLGAAAAAWLQARRVYLHAAHFEFALDMHVPVPPLALFEGNGAGCMGQQSGNSAGLFLSLVRRTRAMADRHPIHQLCFWRFQTLPGLS